MDCYLKYLKQPQNFGTFMVNTYLMFNETNPKSAAIIFNAMRKLMTLKNSDLDLASISKLFTLNNFENLILTKLEESEPCLKRIIELDEFKEELSSLFENNLSLKDFKGSIFFDHSPCKNNSKYSECIEYCLWQENMNSNKSWKNDILDLMR